MTNDSREKAIDEIKYLQANMGDLNMVSPISMAIEQSEDVEPDLKQRVFILTDGKIQQVEQVIA